MRGRQSPAGTAAGDGDASAVKSGGNIERGKTRTKKVRGEGVVELQKSTKKKEGRKREKVILKKRTTLGEKLAP